MDVQLPMINVKFFVAAGVKQRKMTSNEDGDLIDLGNDACVPRVPIQESLPDEQEHLLDVCPPKLEQTLSLTRKQEQVQSVSDNGDVLVTLGHDQVVPIRKRIDVVSSDTIKRVRDITRNLEPVIRKTCSDINEEHQDTVDHGSASNREEGRYISQKHDDETFEAQEITNAFNFLAEHEEAEDKPEASHDRRKELGNSFSGSVLLRRSENEDLLDYHHDSPRPLTWEASSNSLGLKDDLDLNNLDFELSSGSTNFCESISRNGRSSSVDHELEASNKVVAKKRRGEETLNQATGRGSFQRAHRKSWTEGISLRTAPKDSLPRFEKSINLEETTCEPSTSNAAHRQSSFISRYVTYLIYSILMCYRHNSAFTIRSQFAR